MLSIISRKLGYKVQVFGMLIEFSVANFRSIREKQTFSMVAAPKLRKRENVFIPVVKGEKLPALLKVAAIYGPNASGKSNFIDAMNTVFMLARGGGQRPISVSSFRFDPQLATAPTEFELNFIANAQRFLFEVSCTSERIMRECLISYPNGKETLLYERMHLHDTDEYTFGRDLEGGSTIHEAWKKLTGPRMLFLSQAVANSNEDLKQLRLPLGWLTNQTMTIASQHMNHLAESTKTLAAEFPIFSDDVSRFLQEIDVPITNIEVMTPKVNTLSNLRLDSDNPITINGDTPRKNKATLTHKTAMGEAKFDFSEESTGTQNLIGFWLPWNQLGRRLNVLIVDELDSSLHPKIVASLISNHIRMDQPTQLIFTTHDTHLMDTKLLRRDQFWITERDENGATQLRSIHDFEGRESEDIEKRYFEGRYRGLPLIRKG